MSANCLTGTWSWAILWPVDKYVYSRPAADDIIDELATSCDFVVTAIAD